MIKYSIIIPTYNCYNTIYKTLTSLIKQSSFAKLSKITEIIIVDDGSFDETVAVIEKFISKYPEYKIIYLYQENRGTAAARNTGIQFSKGSIIFFTDADCQVPKDWMEQILNLYKKYPEIIGVGGWLNPSQQDLKVNPYQQFIYLFHRYSWGIGLDTFSGKNGEYFPFPAVNTANISYKKWVLQQVGGFETRLNVMEDIELSRRIQNLGFFLYYLPLQVIHLKKINLVTFIHICIERAKDRKILKQLYPSTKFKIDFFLKSFLDFCNFYNNFKQPKVKFKNKIKTLIVAFIWFLLFYVYSL